MLATAFAGAAPSWLPRKNAAPALVRVAEANVRLWLAETFVSIPTVVTPLLNVAAPTRSLLLAKVDARTSPEPVNVMPAASLIRLARFVAELSRVIVPLARIEVTLFSAPLPLISIDPAAMKRLPL